LYAVCFLYFVFYAVKKSQKGPAKKVNKCQTWITSGHVWDLLILVIVRVLYVHCMRIKKYIDFTSNLHFNLHICII